VAAIATISKGYDSAYPFKQMRPENVRAGADYYLVAGEPYGRWLGRGAAELGLAPGSRISREVFTMVVARRLDPRDGTTRLGRSPQGAQARTQAIYQASLAAEPHATAHRKHELWNEALRKSRQGPLFYDLTLNFSKSISVFYASLGENARRARLSGDKAQVSYWTGLLAELDEMIMAAARAGMEFFEREAGYTRSGYHGSRVGAAEAGKFHEAGLIIGQFLQHTSRGDDIHIHVHNVIAHAAMTFMDGRWRAPDSYGYNEVHTAVAAIASLHLEAAMRRRFGVQWQMRGVDEHGKDAFGAEIKGIGRPAMKCFSTGRIALTERSRALAAEFERAYGRAPSQRELMKLREKAHQQTRRGKESGPLDLNALYSDSAERLRQGTGEDLASICGLVADLDAQEHGLSQGPDTEELAMAARMALARCQSARSVWSRYDLIRHLGEVLPSSVRDLDSDATTILLLRLADEIIAGKYGPVRNLEAPGPVEVPESLIRADGRPVYKRHMGTRYATGGQLSAEEELLAHAARPCRVALEREHVAELLGSDVFTLRAQLDRKPEAGCDQRTSTGLRLDQAAAIWHALTDSRTGVVFTGPPGSGKTHSLAAAALVAKRMGVPEVWATTCSQAARNVVAEACGRAGVKVRAYNTTALLYGLRRPLTNPYHLRIAPGSLILMDEASMTSQEHTAAIMRIAAARGCKVIVAGDQEQLAAVEGGGAMRMLSRAGGYVQLAEPMRFAHEWERTASLRLRAGDVSVLDVYDTQGRVHGAEPELAMDDAVRTYVARVLEGDNALLMAQQHEHVTELSRRVREELVHLGLVADGPGMAVGEHAEGTQGDLVILRQNDHKLGLANGDVMRIEHYHRKVSRVIIRKVMDRDPVTGETIYSLRALHYGSLEAFDLAYATTVHTAQGKTVGAGIALVTGSESRQWLTVALTRGAEQNHAFVMENSPKQADAQAGPAPGPEIDRYDRMERQAQRDTGEQADEPERPELPDRREAIAVLADVVERDGSARSALEYEREQLANADHLGLLNSMFTDVINGPRTERYQQLLRDALPPEYRDGTEESPQATWLWRTLRSVEAAGLDVAEVLQQAVDSRPLSRARNIAAVVDKRIRNATGELTPRPLESWADQVPQIGDPRQQKFATDLAAAMDERVARLGPFMADTQPEWAVNSLGEVPADPQARGEWEAKAGKVAAYREMFGWKHPSDALGPEPSVHSPEQRMVWHAGRQVLAPDTGPDVRSMSTGQLENLREGYAAETGWAPAYVTPALKHVRQAAQAAANTSLRADAEAKVAEGTGDATKAEAHRQHGASSARLAQMYEQHAEGLAKIEEAYNSWHTLTQGMRDMSAAADAELRRRRPGSKIERLVSAEPGQITPEQQAELDTPPQPDGSVAEPLWLTRLKADRMRVVERIAEQQSQRVPDEDPDYTDSGPAWPHAPRVRDAVLQPPAPEIRPSERALEAQRQREAESEPDAS
jgi:hypothetical protein